MNCTRHKRNRLAKTSALIHGVASPHRIVGLCALISQLRPTDYFSICIFNNAVRDITPGPLFGRMTGVSARECKKM
jgi:hypothetical protein